jgi:hypothetical protein
MTDKIQPTIETQIKEIIGETMMAFHLENKQIISDTIKIVVNGKIDKFRAEQQIVNNLQSKALVNIQESVKDIIHLREGTGLLFRGIQNVAIWIAAVGGASVVVWGFIRFVVNTSIIK